MAQQQKRKRGGLAGIWDRNKGIIKTVVPTVVGAFGGPVGVPMAAMTRAAMEGLDRPGKRGIGLDLGAYARGAAVGAGQGAMGAGVRNLLAPAQTVPSAAGAMPRPSITPNEAGSRFFPRQASTVPGTTGTTPPPRILERLFTGRGTPSGSESGTAPMTFRQSLMQPQVLASGVQGLLGMLPSPETDIKAGELDLNRQRFAEQQRLNQIELQRRQMVMQLLMPYLQQQLPNLNLAAFGGVPQR